MEMPGFDAEVEEQAVQIISSRFVLRWHLSLVHRSHQGLLGAVG
jgi:hypothetical protein